MFFVAEFVETSLQTIFVRSANGRTDRASLSNPITFSDPLTHRNTKLQVVLASSCPYNLLGREVMAKLGIGIVPDGKGNMVARQPGATDLFVFWVFIYCFVFKVHQYSYGH